MTPYFDDLRAALTNANEDEWVSRTSKSARHILIAVCFRETSENTVRLTSSVLFAPIGFYYSLFHLGVATLWLDYQTAQSELNRVRHDKVRLLVQDRLVNRGVLPNSFLALFLELQNLREFANYTFGERLSRYNFKSITSELYQRTGVSFDDGLKFIHQVQQAISEEAGFYSPIQTAIGDGFGDNLIREYLSAADEKRVWKYLLSRNLTT